ncbi:peptidase S8/S53 domain-containing protein [Cladochytrium replicatum]|nr:peptidase S8/S53 domain-containing protein [Cladochytrium replicatum]
MRFLIIALLSAFFLAAGSEGAKSPKELKDESVPTVPTIKYLPGAFMVEFSDEKQLSTGSKSTAPSDYSPHVMTQVDRLRAEGYAGKGIRISIIDTGVDFQHPALGGCFEPGCLIGYGTDLVGDDYVPEAIPQPFDIPNDCAGHGTHESGIIAVMPNELNFTGAAPGVELGMYRVFGCAGGVSEDVLIQAWLRAYVDKSRIITASLGRRNGWPESATSAVVSRIVEQGVIVTAAAGNNGDVDLFGVSTSSDFRRNRDAGFPNLFTSWGPTREVEVKSQFTTPGGSILSTFPLDQGGYAIASGTSMATPLAASILALVASARQNFNSTFLERILSATAKPNLLHDPMFFSTNTPETYPIIAPLAQQVEDLCKPTTLSISKLA